MLAITQARLILGTGAVVERGTVVVRDGRIADVGPDRLVRVPRAATRLSARGLTLLPGLIDCHVHFSLGAEPDVVAAVRRDAPALTLLKAARYARATLEAGFTTVRDLGARNHDIFALQRAIEADLLPGPRILAAGLAICMPGGHAAFIGREADGPADVARAVREQVAAGAGVIKLIATGGVLTPGTKPDLAQLTFEELSAGVRAARRAGLRIAAHAHGAAGMLNAARAGVHSIEHATLLDDEAAALLKARQVFVVPTLSALATTAEGGTACGIPASAVGKAKKIVPRHEASFRQAYAAGIPIALGTDAGTPLNEHGTNAQELTRMVALGMAPLDAIRSATQSAATLLGIEREVGTLVRGKIADLLVVNGNPLDRMGVLQDRKHLLGVMQGGRFVSGPLAAFFSSRYRRV